MNVKIRQQVFWRARGMCEARCGRPVTSETGHLDHFFGRAKAEETIENCWALCVLCDAEKTASKPDAATWLRKYVRHLCPFVADGNAIYWVALERTFDKLAVLKAKGHA